TKRARGATTRNADRPVPKDWGRSAAWIVTPQVVPSPLLPSAGRGRGVSPGAGHEARLPVRQKLHCEAPTGVADPVTTWSSESGRLYPGGRVVLVSRKPSTQQSSVDC